MTTYKTRRSGYQNFSHTGPYTTRIYPQVSFIIPTLNAERFLGKCLDAIRTQKYPQKKVEIVIADGGSTDKTLAIAKKFHAKVIPNPDVLHEPGKFRATQVAKGELLFFTDSDNILSTPHWISLMVRPYIEHPEIKAIQPQTLPPPKWNTFDRYLGVLSTDTFSWFVYGYASNPATFKYIYEPKIVGQSYIIYKFIPPNYPLIGLSQGFGTVSSYRRSKISRNDDILSGIELVNQGALIAYVPEAGIYHYHVKSISQFVHKYSWRVRNNLNQKVAGMGLVNRKKYLTPERKIRIALFPFYSLLIPLTIIDTFRLYLEFKNPVVIWHPFACLLLTTIIVKEYLFKIFGMTKYPDRY